MLVNIYMKFHGDILNGFQVTDLALFCDGHTYGRTDYPGKNNMSPNLKMGGGGGHNNTFISRG